jgi:hypothetical protein
MNPFRPPPFVGRRAELSEALRYVRSGTSVLLIGGRRAGKTFLVDQLVRELRAGVGVPSALAQRVLVTDASGWRRASETDVLAELAALSGAAGPTRREVERALEALAPLVLVVDEADVLLGEPWSRQLFQWLRYLDDKLLQTGLAFVLVGGPQLDDWRDPDDRGSPPLNTAEPVYLEPLDGGAVEQLVSLGEGRWTAELRRAVGHHPWLLMLTGEALHGRRSAAQALERLATRCSSSFTVWERQLGAGGVKLLRALHQQPAPCEDFQPGGRRAKERAALLRCRYVGVVKEVDGAWHAAVGLFLDHLPEGRAAYDLAISYAREDEAIARAIKAELREFRVFFDLDEEAWLWGQPLSQVLPAIYEVEARHVLVLSSAYYVRKHWTKLELDAVMRGAPGRLLMVDLGAWPEDVPSDWVAIRGDEAGMVRLVPALRSRLSAARAGG